MLQGLREANQSRIIFANMGETGGKEKKVLIVVPTYNERDNLKAITRAVFEHMPRAHLLVVDDASPDGTGELAEELRVQDPRIRVIHRAGKQGLGTAYVTGFRYALARDYTHVFEMDADFSHDPKYLPLMLERSCAGADLVLGSRYVRGGGTENWGFGRQLISMGGSTYARSVLGVRVKDLTGGFKCFKREVLETLDLRSVRSEGYSFQIEMTYRTVKAGFTVEEFPIVFVDRRVGQSKMSRKIVLEAIWMVWALRLGLKLPG
jgi:dolichol-phosphate mannosyltransferase